jgi:hypothetical protein
MRALAVLDKSKIQSVNQSAIAALHPVASSFWINPITISLFAIAHYFFLPLCLSLGPLPNSGESKLRLV